MLWLLVLVPLLGAAGIALRRPDDRVALARAAAATLTFTLLLTVLALAGDWSSSLGWTPALRLQAELVPVSAVVAITVPAVALPIVLYASAHEAHAELPRLIALLLAFVGAMELLVIAADLLTLLIGWELVGACSWALIGHHWRNAANSAAAGYAFTLTRLGDLGLFVAAMVAFAGTGSLAYASLAQLSDPLLGLAAGGVLVSAAAKSGQLPFAPWLFRAMAGPTSVSALLHAAAMVAAGAFLVARLQPLFAEVAWFGPAATGVGLTTALAGGVVATVQADVKKLLAASTSAHYGLMFVAVGAGYPVVAVLHLVAHAAFKALLFLTAGIAGERKDTFRLASPPYGRALPCIGVGNAVGALALAGIPPLGGAWTKEAVVAAAGHAGPALAVGVMLAGGLSAIYAARNHLLMWGAGAADGETAPPHRLEYGAIGALAVATVVLSLLWLPGVQRALKGSLAADLPHAAGWELALSLVIVFVGVYAGWLLVRRFPELGQREPALSLSDWLGLPTAIRTLGARPLAGLARTAAALDDRVVDAVPRGAAAFGHALATLGSRFGEVLADGLPSGLGQIVGLGGLDARRLQTGMSQHYYAMVAVGAGLFVLILLLGAI